MTRWVPLAVLLAGVVLMFSPVGSWAGEPGADASRGEASYQANCAMCHGADATGMMGMHPALRGVVDRLTVEGVTVTIRRGRDTRPPMPAFGDRLTEDDIGDLIAYLDTLPPGPRNFGPGAGGAPMSDGMGDMMRDMMGAGAAALWIAIVVLTAVLSGLIGYLMGRRRRQSSSGPSV